MCGIVPLQQPWAFLPKYNNVAFGAHMKYLRHMPTVSEWSQYFAPYFCMVDKVWTPEKTEVIFFYLLNNDFNLIAIIFFCVGSFQSDETIIRNVIFEVTVTCDQKLNIFS